VRALAFDPTAQSRFAVSAKESADRPGWLTSDYLGNKIPEPYDTKDGVRVIPLQGAITRGLGLLGQYFGMADTDRFTASVKAASEDPRVSKILLHIQSPGGDAVGCYEAAQAVANAAAVKPVYAFCDDVMASAAYFIGSSANFIYATPSSLVGSIGTYTVLTDDGEYWKKMGVEFMVVRSGKFKGAGIDGFSAEQIAEIQAMIDSYGEQFRAFVDTARNGDVKREQMEGQVWLGADASKNGIADGNAQSLSDMLSLIAKKSY
jgi:signal peptide peptidase SppA